MDPGYYPALIIGLIGSTVIHLSQGLLKLAIYRRQSGDRSVGNRYLYGFPSYCSPWLRGGSDSWIRYV